MHAKLQRTVNQKRRKTIIDYLVTTNGNYTLRQIMEDNTAADLWQQNDGSRNSLYMERSDLCFILVAGEQIHDTVVKIRY